MIVFAENPEELLGKRLGFVRTPRVGHGLAAAGLLFGKIDIDAKLPQHSKCRQSYLGVELIDVARNKKAYFWHAAPQRNRREKPHTRLDLQPAEAKV